MRSAAKAELSEALLHYEKAVELRPDYADGHYNLGNLLLRQGKIDKAITEWEKTVSIQPDDAEAHTVSVMRFCKKVRCAKPLIITKKPSQRTCRRYLL